MSQPEATQTPKPFEPKIVTFLCKWCSSAGSDLAGVSRLQYASNTIPITVNCSGGVSPLYILSAFNKGADGIMVSGCHPGDCHYMEGNYQARRKIYLLQELVAFIGMEPERFRMSWVSAAEGAKFAHIMDEFTEEIRQLGPQTKLKVKLDD